MVILFFQDGKTSGKDASQIIGLLFTYFEKEKNGLEPVTCDVILRFNITI